MINRDMLQSIYAHARWAHGELFDTAAQISEEQLTKATDGNDSIFDLLFHLVDVQRTWLARAQHTVVAPLDPASCSTLAALRGAWERVDNASRVYVARLSPDDLVEIVRYTKAQGEPQAYPRWQILLHEALHAAQHRSEAALLLSALGYSTGWLDYLISIDETRAA